MPWQLFVKELDVWTSGEFSAPDVWMSEGNMGPVAAKESHQAPLIGALVGGRFRIVQHRSAGCYGHGWEAVDAQSSSSERVFLRTMRHEYDPPEYGMDPQDMQHVCFKEMEAVRFLHRCGF